MKQMEKCVKRCAGKLRSSREEAGASGAQVQTELGPIGLLVNNAGLGIFGPVHEKSEEEWDRLVDTNLKSVFLVSRAVIPGMIERGGGDVINISSLAGKSVFAGGG